MRNPLARFRRPRGGHVPGHTRDPDNIPVILTAGAAALPERLRGHISDDALRRLGVEPENVTWVGWLGNDADSA